MGSNYTLKYKRFDQLLDEVMVDLKNYSLENLVEPQELIKVAKRVTYDLGLRIYQTKEALLEVCNGKIKLPDDFYVFNFGLLCGQYTVDVSLPQGTNIQEKSYIPYTETPANVDLCAAPVVCAFCNSPASPPSCNCPQTVACGTTPEVPAYNPLVPYGDTCVKPRVFMNCKGQAYELIQVVNTETRTFRTLLPLKLRDNSDGIECGCPNLYMKAPEEIWIKDGWLYSNFQVGKVYINYQGMLEDSDGGLMVADHEYLNEYYEYALKERLLENLFYNKEDVINQLRYTQEKLNIARRVAKSFVLTPNFGEMKQLWLTNRQAQMNKYYYMFGPTTDRFIGFNNFTLGPR